MIFNKNDNGTEEIKLIATWTSRHDYEYIYPALLLAKRKVLKIIDKTTYGVALDHYNSADYETESTPDFILLDELVHWFQRVFVNFAYSKNLHKDTVLWGNDGINITWSDNFRPAQADTLTNLQESLDKDGYEFLDLLIEFLNDEEETFTDFKESLEGKQLKTLFINDAEDFNYYFSINESVSYFFLILDAIRRVQRTYISSAIGADYYAKVENYQLKRLELETATIDSYPIIDDLPPTATTGDIALVVDIETYYKYDGAEWLEYSYDARDLLNLIKPCLVDYTIYMKFYSDISNLKGDTKQLELLRANAEILLQKAKASEAHIVAHIDMLEYVEPDETMEEETKPYNATTNSFIM